jgi:hypothetical protein
VEYTVFILQHEYKTNRNIFFLFSKIETQKFRGILLFRLPISFFFRDNSQNMDRGYFGLSDVYSNRVIINYLYSWNQHDNFYEIEWISKLWKQKF